MFRSIVLLEGKHSAHLRSWMLWTGFSLRPSQYFGALSFSSILTSTSVPAAEEQPHSMRLLPAHFTFRMVFCMWWSVPAFLQTWCLELRFIRPQNIISQSGGPLGAVLRILLVSSLRRGLSWPHRYKAQIGGVLQWCLSFCRCLLSPHMIMELN